MEMDVQRDCLRTSPAFIKNYACGCKIEIRPCQKPQQAHARETRTLTLDTVASLTTVEPPSPPAPNGSESILTQILNKSGSPRSNTQSGDVVFTTEISERVSPTSRQTSKSPDFTWKSIDHHETSPSVVISHSPCRKENGTCELELPRALSAEVIQGAGEAVLEDQIGDAKRRVIESEAPSGVHYPEEDCKCTFNTLHGNSQSDEAKSNTLDLSSSLRSESVKSKPEKSLPPTLCPCGDNCNCIKDSDFMKVLNFSNEKLSVSYRLQSDHEDVAKVIVVQDTKNVRPRSKSSRSAATTDTPTTVVSPTVSGDIEDRLCTGDDEFRGLSSRDCARETVETSLETSVCVATGRGLGGQIVLEEPDTCACDEYDPSSWGTSENRSRRVPDSRTVHDLAWTTRPLEMKEYLFCPPDQCTCITLTSDLKDVMAEPVGVPVESPFNRRHEQESVCDPETERSERPHGVPEGETLEHRVPAIGRKSEAMTVGSRKSVRIEGFDSCDIPEREVPYVDEVIHESILQERPRDSEARDSIETITHKFNVASQSAGSKSGTLADSRSMTRSAGSSRPTVHSGSGQRESQKSSFLSDGTAFSGRTSTNYPGGGAGASSSWVTPKPPSMDYSSGPCDPGPSTCGTSSPLRGVSVTTTVERSSEVDIWRTVLPPRISPRESAPRGSLMSKLTLETGASRLSPTETSDGSPLTSRQRSVVTSEYFSCGHGSDCTCSDGVKKSKSRTNESGRTPSNSPESAECPPSIDSTAKVESRKSEVSSTPIGRHSTEKCPRDFPCNCVDCRKKVKTGVQKDSIFSSPGRSEPSSKGASPSVDSGRRAASSHRSRTSSDASERWRTPDPGPTPWNTPEPRSRGTPSPGQRDSVAGSGKKPRSPRASDASKSTSGDHCKASLSFTENVSVKQSVGTLDSTRGTTSPSRQGTVSPPGASPRRLSPEPSRPCDPGRTPSSPRTTLESPICGGTLSSPRTTLESITTGGAPSNRTAASRSLSSKGSVYPGATPWNSTEPSVGRPSVSTPRWHHVIPKCPKDYPCDCIDCKKKAKPKSPRTSAASGAASVSQGGTRDEISVGTHGPRSPKTSDGSKSACRGVSFQKSEGMIDQCRASIEGTPSTRTGGSGSLASQETACTQGSTPDPSRPCDPERATTPSTRTAASTSLSSKGTVYPGATPWSTPEPSTGRPSVCPTGKCPRDRPCDCTDCKKKPKPKTPPRASAASGTTAVSSGGVCDNVSMGTTVPKPISTCDTTGYGEASPSFRGVSFEQSLVSFDIGSPPTGGAQSIRTTVSRSISSKGTVCPLEAVPEPSRPCDPGRMPSTTPEPTFVGSTSTRTADSRSVSSKGTVYPGATPWNTPEPHGSKSTTRTSETTAYGNRYETSPSFGGMSFEQSPLTLDLGSPATFRTPTTRTAASTSLSSKGTVYPGATPWSTPEPSTGRPSVCPTGKCPRDRPCDCVDCKKKPKPMTPPRASAASSTTAKSSGAVRDNDSMGTTGPKPISTYDTTGYGDPCEASPSFRGVSTTPWITPEASCGRPSVSPTQSVGRPMSAPRASGVSAATSVSYGGMCDDVSTGTPGPRLTTASDATTFSHQSETSPSVRYVSFQQSTGSHEECRASLDTTLVPCDPGRTPPSPWTTPEPTGGWTPSIRTAASRSLSSKGSVYAGATPWNTPEPSIGRPSVSSPRKCPRDRPCDCPECKKKPKPKSPPGTAPYGSVRDDVSVGTTWTGATMAYEGVSPEKSPDTLDPGSPPRRILPEPSRPHPGQTTSPWTTPEPTGGGTPSIRTAASRSLASQGTVYPGATPWNTPEPSRGRPSVSPPRKCPRDRPCDCPECKKKPKPKSSPGTAAPSYGGVCDDISVGTTWTGATMAYEGVSPEQSPDTLDPGSPPRRILPEPSRPRDPGQKPTSPWTTPEPSIRGTPSTRTAASRSLSSKGSVYAGATPWNTPEPSTGRPSVSPPRKCPRDRPCDCPECKKKPKPKSSPGTAAPSYGGVCDDISVGTTWTGATMAYEGVSPEQSPDTLDPGSPPRRISPEPSRPRESGRTPMSPWTTPELTIRGTPSTRTAASRSLSSKGSVYAGATPWNTPEPSTGRPSVSPTQSVGTSRSLPRTSGVSVGASSGGVRDDVSVGTTGTKLSSSAYGNQCETPPTVRCVSFKKSIDSLDERRATLDTALDPCDTGWTPSSPWATPEPTVRGTPSTRTAASRSLSSKGTVYAGGTPWNTPEPSRGSRPSDSQSQRKPEPKSPRISGSSKSRTGSYRGVCDDALMSAHGPARSPWTTPDPTYDGASARTAASVSTRGTVVSGTPWMTPDRGDTPLRVGGASYSRGGTISPQNDSFEFTFESETHGLASSSSPVLFTGSGRLESLTTSECEGGGISVRQSASIESVSISTLLSQRSAPWGTPEPRRHKSASKRGRSRSRGSAYKQQFEDELFDDKFCEEEIRESESRPSSAKRVSSTKTNKSSRFSDNLFDIFDEREDTTGPSRPSMTKQRSRSRSSRATGSESPRETPMSSRMEESESIISIETVVTGKTHKGSPSARTEASGYLSSRATVDPGATPWNSSNLSRGSSSGTRRMESSREPSVGSRAARAALSEVLTNSLTVDARGSLPSWDAREPSRGRSSARMSEGISNRVTVDRESKPRRTRETSAERDISASSRSARRALSELLTSSLTVERERSRGADRERSSTTGGRGRSSSRNTQEPSRSPARTVASRLISSVGTIDPETSPWDTPDPSRGTPSTRRSTYASSSVTVDREHSRGTPSSGKGRVDPSLGRSRRSHSVSPRDYVSRVNDSEGVEELFTSSLSIEVDDEIDDSELVVPSSGTQQPKSMHVCLCEPEPVPVKGRTRSSSKRSRIDTPIGSIQCSSCKCGGGSTAQSQFTVETEMRDNSSSGRTTVRSKSSTRRQTTSTRSSSKKSRIDTPVESVERSSCKCGGGSMAQSQFTVETEMIDNSSPGRTLVRSKSSTRRPTTSTRSRTISDRSKGSSSLGSSRKTATGKCCPSDCECCQRKSTVASPSSSDRKMAINRMSSTSSRRHRSTSSRSDTAKSSKSFHSPCGMIESSLARQLSRTASVDDSSKSRSVATRVTCCSAHVGDYRKDSSRKKLSFDDKLMNNTTST